MGKEGWGRSPLALYGSSTCNFQVAVECAKRLEVAVGCAKRLQHGCDNSARTKQALKIIHGCDNSARTKQALKIIQKSNTSKHALKDHLWMQQSARFKQHNQNIDSRSSMDAASQHDSNKHAWPCCCLSLTSSECIVWSHCPTVLGR